MSKVTIPPDPSEQQDELLAQAILIEQLSQVDNLDVTKALSNFNSNTQFYLKLVKDFVTEQQQRSQELCDLYQQADWDSLNRRVHSLKAFAAYVGGYSLSKLSADVQESLRQGQCDKPLLDQLCSHMSQLIAQLTPLLVQQNQLATIENANITQSPLSPNKLKSALVQLRPLLLKGNYQAEEQILALRQRSQSCHYGAAIAAIATLVEEVKFDEATQALDQVLADL